MIILSLLLAILIWLVVAMTLYPSIPKTIENIPLSVDIAGSPAADSGLSVISCDVDTVDVQLVGSRKITLMFWEKVKVKNAREPHILKEQSLLLSNAMKCMLMQKTFQMKNRKMAKQSHYLRKNIRNF